jgi:hypothetical protein
VNSAYPRHLLPEEFSEAGKGIAVAALRLVEVDGEAESGG